MHKRPERCRDCDRSDREAGQISFRGLCVECATKRMYRSAKSMQTMKGPMARKWRAGMKRAAGG